jgi:RNA polymerase sigma-70 factor (ECF subfamily)
MPVAQLPDEEIVSRIQAGDRSGLGIAYEKYKRPLYNFCLRLLGDSSAAEDAVHGTFLIIAQRAGTLNNSGAFRHWLYEIARNEALMQLRRRNRFPTESSDSVWDSETPDTILAGKELVAIVQEGLQHLRPDYREILLLRDIEGFTYAEIARITDTTLSAVKSKIYKARNALSRVVGPIENERTVR